MPTFKTWENSCSTTESEIREPAWLLSIITYKNDETIQLSKKLLKNEYLYPSAIEILRITDLHPDLI